MTEPTSEQPEPALELGAPTDVSVAPEDLPADGEESPTGSAAAYEDGDADGGTGGENAGGAG